LLCISACALGLQLLDRAKNPKTTPLNAGDGFNFNFANGKCE
jgi:hypothetical protein